MRIIALTFGDESAASSFYRIYQYVIPLAKLGIELTAHPADRFEDWSSLGDYDVVIVQKKLFSGRQVRLVRKHARRLIYDTDDAIWEPHGRPHHWLISNQNNSLCLGCNLIHFVKNGSKPSIFGRKTNKNKTKTKKMKTISQKCSITGDKIIHEVEPKFTTCTFSSILSP